jgi:exosortase
VDQPIKSTYLQAATFSSGRVSPARIVGFVLVCLLPFAIAWGSTRLLANLIFENETFSQIPLIPLVSAFLIFENRKSVFSNVSFGWTMALALLVPGAILLTASDMNLWHLTATNPQSLFVFAVVCIWLGAFALFFGGSALRAALFPLLFLLFMVPIPEPSLSKTIYLLQAGSAVFVEAFFAVAGIPYHRQQFVFDLPGISIRIAEECSGIRSTLALLITTVLASYIFLKTPWRRLVLCLAVIPIALFKNGLRIATLSILAVYVNPEFLYGNLHQRGGIVFFMIALIPMALLLKFLQKNEAQNFAAPSVDGIRPSPSQAVPRNNT